MIIHTDSFRYLWEVLEREEYHFMLEDFVIMDLGCNIGSFSLWAYPFARQIHAIDKDQSAVDLLNQTIKANVLTKIKTYTSKLGEGNTLAGFMSGHAIPFVDILKIDIEGDELSVVEAADFPVDRVNALLGEHHFQDPEHQRFIDRINALGYTYKELPNNHFIARKQ